MIHKSAIQQEYKEAGEGREDREWGTTVPTAKTTYDLAI
jgi:hypothetical protein